jgi:hypothetical protein
MVVGGVLLRYDTTGGPGQTYWRHAAKRAADQIIGRIGGVSWDERGQVNMVVPHHFVAQAAEMMALVRPYRDGEEDQKNLAEGLRRGGAEVIMTPGGLALRWTSREVLAPTEAPTGKYLWAQEPTAQELAEQALEEAMEKCSNPMTPPLAPPKPEWKKEVSV